ncbi:hypothetical protein WR25_17153 [Diploscapter pachys]|uniref:Uncharacterized protein n=1 Tax=Diploscapter pachys TaxID=2018661 RepID=A0A2A2JH14_9BILA|nr:hypothetical protein WR25_17153 [Diploscapter pachys]
MSTATAMRDSLIDKGLIVIPRPHYNNMQFVATRGRQGFYRTIRENGAQYGVNIRPQGARRPQLNANLFVRPDTLKEEDEESISTSSGTATGSSLGSAQQTQTVKRTSPGISSSHNQVHALFK